MTSEHSTIECVVERKLCSGCGTCAGICPYEALEMVVNEKQGCYVPRLDKELCTRCGLCYQACPGHGVDFEALNEALLGPISEDVALGRYLGCYIGHATDERVRYDAASGGIVSALLTFALETGLIDGALVTRMRRDEPLRPEPFVARTKDEILSAMGSKYCPVAAGAALQDILRSEGRFAVVGLPCHIQGIRKAEQHLSGLRERVRFRIGIACSLDFSFRGTEHFLASIGVSPSAVEWLRYRGGGWPGAMTIRLKDGSEKTVAKDEYARALRPYALRRCTLCSDMFGELSDVSCGDAWIPAVMRADKVGSSFVVSRTTEAEALLEQAAAHQVITLSELDLSALLASQNHARFKKRKLPARLRLFRLVGQSTPTYRQRLLTPMRQDYFNMAKFYVARYALSGNRRVLGGLFRMIRRLKRALRARPRRGAGA